MIYNGCGGGGWGYDIHWMGEFHWLNWMGEFHDLNEMGEFHDSNGMRKGVSDLNCMSGGSFMIVHS